VTGDVLQNLTNAILVVAHPDDEVLWFSSILERVGRITICYEDCADLPELGPARRAARASYPLAKVDWLALPEPCSVHLVDWEQPTFGPHGLLLNAASGSEERRARYVESFSTLRTSLAARLRGVTSVVTHNPWGEYGHPDHVQVARVVESVQQELGFSVLYSGYVASRTMPLCARELPRLDRAFSLPTDQRLAEVLTRLYVEQGAWTWPLDHQRFAHECFLGAGGGSPRAGTGFPLNCVTA